MIVNWQKFESLIIIATRLLGKDYMNGIMEMEKFTLQLSDIIEHDFITDISDLLELKFSLSEKCRSDMMKKYPEIFSKFEEAMLFYTYCEKCTKEDNISINFSNGNPNIIYNVYSSISEKGKSESYIFTDGNIIPVCCDGNDVISENLGEMVEVEGATYVILSKYCDRKLDSISIKTIMFDSNYFIEQITKIKNGLDYGYIQVGHANPKKYMLMRQ